MSVHFTINGCANVHKVFFLFFPAANLTHIFYSLSNKDVHSEIIPVSKFMQIRIENQKCCIGRILKRKIFVHASTQKGYFFPSIY